MKVNRQARLEQPQIETAAAPQDRGNSTPTMTAEDHDLTGPTAAVGLKRRTTASPRKRTGRDGGGAAADNRHDGERVGHDLPLQAAQGCGEDIDWKQKARMLPIDPIAIATSSTESRDRSSHEPASHLRMRAAERPTSEPRRAGDRRQREHQRAQLSGVFGFRRVAGDFAHRGLAEPEVDHGGHHGERAIESDEAITFAPEHPVIDDVERSGKEQSRAAPAKLGSTFSS